MAAWSVKWLDSAKVSNPFRLSEQLKESLPRARKIERRLSIRKMTLIF